MTLREKLGAIQSELKAPKGQFNSFGKYKYRSCEDILEAVKPLLKSIKETIKKNPDLLSEQGLCKKFGIKTLKDMTLLNLREVIEYLDKQKSEAKDDKK